MNRQRGDRTVGPKRDRASGAPTVRGRARARARAHTHTRAGNRDRVAVLSLLSAVLVDEVRWSMPEVQRLIAMRDLADLGRWRVAGLDDMETGSA